MAAPLAGFVGWLMYFAAVGLVGYFFGFGVSAEREARRRRRRR